MRIAFATLGTRGDVQPSLAVAQAMRAAGHDAFLLSSPDFEEWAVRCGVPLTPHGPAAHAVLAERPSAISHPADFQWMVRSFLDSSFEDLPRQLAGVDLVVGAGLQMAAMAVAQQMGIPSHYLLYCPQVLRSAHHPPIFVPWQSAPKWLNRAAWWVASDLATTGMNDWLCDRHEQLGLPPIESANAFLCATRWIAACDPDLAPMPPDLVGPQTGFCPLPDSGEATLPAEVEAFLNAGEPPLFVGFGSMLARDAARWTRVVLEAAGKVGMRVLLSGGWGGYGQGELPDYAMAVGACNHEALFPRVLAVLHHGGAGTTQTAARAGVPQIVVPHGVDQYWWAHRVAVLGIGPPPLSPLTFWTSVLVLRLKELRNTPSFASKAKDLGQRMRARNGLQLTVDLLERSLASI